jgi:hypothetical protein
MSTDNTGPKSIESAIAEALEAMAQRRPTPLEVKSLAANIAAEIEAEMDKRIAKAIAST